MGRRTLGDVLVVVGVLRPIPVTKDQLIEFEVEDEGREVELEAGILEIATPGLTLHVTATDANGNTATASANPLFLTGDSDDPGDVDD